MSKDDIFTLFNKAVQSDPRSLHEVGFQQWSDYMSKSKPPFQGSTIRNAPPSATMVDISRPYEVEVHISQDAKTLWVNVDGVCRLRAGRIETLVLLNDSTGVNEVCIAYQDPQPPEAA
jgi:hypothetical protein